MMTSRRSSRISLSLQKKKSVEHSQREGLKVKFVSDDDVAAVIFGIQELNSEQNEATGTVSKPVSGTPKSNRKSRKRTISNVGVETIEEETFEEETESHIEEKCEKPRDLCDEDEVEGGKICSFRTPRKRQGMLQKALESAGKQNRSETPKPRKTPSKVLTPRRALPIGSPVTPSTRAAKTPLSQTLRNRNQTPSKSVGESVISIAKTPYNTRARTVKAIKVYKKQLEYEDPSEDETGSDSDFEGSASESSDSEPSDDDDSDRDSGKGSEGPRRSCRRSLRFQPMSAKSRGKDANYIFTADEYFESKSTKSKTSDHVLSRLRTPRLDAADVLQLLKNSSVAPAHCSVLAKRRAGDIDTHERWMIALSQGFSILAYGLGSKYKILQNFYCKMLPNSHVLVVNGFFPSLSIKEIVDSIATDLLGLKHSLPSPHAVIDWIEGRRWMPRVFLVIHNIDAEPLRCDKTQQLLARLASLPRVHLVASVDHINCPLLWDQAKLSAFNFVWEDTTSFLPYQEETSYENSLMVHNSGSLALSSLLNVYRSLTQNSRGVFRIILQKHLDENNPKYNGMAFSDLYSRCREEMLVTSDLALRTMLTEFLDHDMVKFRKDMEHLYIPTDIGVLRQFSSLTLND